MFTARLLSAVFAFAVSLSFGIPRVSAAILAAGHTDPRTNSGGRSAIVRTSVYYDITVLPSFTHPRGDPGLFSNLSITPDLAPGTIFVATAASDPFFDSTVAQLTNGTPDNVWHGISWQPSSTLTSGGSPERAFFGLPAGAIDLKGQTINAIGLQINWIDQFFYTTRDTHAPAARYRIDSTILISDTATIDAPVLPRAIGMAARPNAFQLNLGETLLLDASHSLGDIAQYQWDLDRDGVYDITTADPQTLLTAEQYAPYLTAGSNRLVRLLVTDAAGRTSLSLSDGFTYVVPEPASIASLALPALLLARRQPRGYRRSRAGMRSDCLRQVAERREAVKLDASR